MGKYNNVFFTPLKVIIINYSFLIVFLSVLFKLNLYRDNEYFAWGPPVFIFKKTITSNWEFYLLLGMFLINKMINTLVTEVVYTWIVNCIQDPKSTDTFYTKNVSLLIILLNSMHLSISTMFTINGSSAQVSFLITDLFGNLLVIFYTNKRFIDRIHAERQGLNEILLDHVD